jgi:hypothetical protein
VPFINLPPVVSEMFWDLDRRIRSLETAFRFNAPNIDFATNTPSNPRTGDMFYDTDAELLKYWNGTQWIEVADNNLSTSITTTTNAILNTTGTAPTYTGNPVLVESQRIGKMITAYVEIVGTTVTNWGTGQIYFTLPVGFPTFAHDVIASGTILDNGTLYTIFGKIAQGDNKMYLFHPTSNGGSDEVTHNKPAVLDSTSVITINGVAILA